MLQVFKQFISATVIAQCIKLCISNPVWMFNKKCRNKRNSTGVILIGKK